MKIILCPSSPAFMPYLKLYANIASDPDVCWIIWNRLDQDIGANFHGRLIIYSDKKGGHSRGFLDYVKFARFAARWLIANASREDSCVIFGLQLLFFLWPVFWFRKLKFAIDIRDYHHVLRFIPGFVFKKACFVAISSPAYARFLPFACKSVVSHNYSGWQFSSPSPQRKQAPYVLSCIGAISYFEANAYIIRKLCNSEKFMLRFDGRGVASDRLLALVEELAAINVLFSGFYDEKFEPELYFQSHMVTLLVDHKSINGNLCLANRLYNAAFFRVPILCFEGSLIAKYVLDFGLGLCIKRSDDLESLISEYLGSFDISAFNENARRFLEFVVDENMLFVSTYQSYFLEETKDV